MDLLSFYDRAVWKKSFALWPRRCNISNRLIWLTYGYKGTVIWREPGGNYVDEYKWHDAIEHSVFILKSGKRI